MQVALTDYHWAEVASRLANTTPAIWHGTDQLPDPASLAAFLREQDVSTHPSDDPLEHTDLEAVHRLRDRLRSVVRSDDEETGVRRASALLADADARLTLDRDEDGNRRWVLAIDDDRPLAERLAAATGVGLLAALRSLGFDRFRACAAPTCDGVFVDLSRPGKRRYCMPELCGNRVNVANHRARSRRP